MESTILSLTAPVVANLRQRLEVDSADLVGRYQQTLRENMFTNRSTRPAMLARIATDEVTVFLDFLENPLREVAQARGAHLCDIGLSELSVLGLSEATRHFFLGRLHNDLIVPTLQAIDAYHQAVIQGFLQNREKVILNEQERIRSALQRTLGRFTVQFEAAAGVASATTTILNLDNLLDTAVELIRERFDLYYVGFFLLDESNQWAILRAGTGEAGQIMIQQGHKVEVGSTSMVGRCVALGEPRVALDVGRELTHFENPLLPETHSEAVIPLISHGKTIGAITVQSQRVAAFADQDVVALRILADQLANAIANANLFAELSRSEEKYRSILENIEEGYYEMDQEYRFTFVNDSLCRILGYPRDEIIGVTQQRLIAPEDMADATKSFRSLYETANPARSVEYKIVQQNGEKRFVETSASLMKDAAGQTIGLRGIVRDITDRKQAEQLSIERKALERSNKELEQFASVASHDLQEPLRKIQAFGDRLRIKNGPTLGQEGLDYLERMLGATRRMQTLIDDLLALSRVATKGQPFVSVDLNRLVREVISDLEGRLEQTGGRVEVDQLPTIYADALQMRQLLQNLIGNGLKFHKPAEAPHLKVSGQLINGSGSNHNSLCEIRVADNGIGFDEKYLDRIFQTFQRLHGQTEYDGTGIGLSICQRIVERHGGSITATSQPGRGATFIITLPVHERHTAL